MRALQQRLQLWTVLQQDFKQVMGTTMGKVMGGELFKLTLLLLILRIVVICGAALRIRQVTQALVILGGELIWAAKNG
jgi:hypothetical protein